MRKSIAGAVWIAGIFTAVPGGAATLTRIADTTTQAGDGSTLRTFFTPQIAGGSVVFGGISQNGLYALYAAPAAGGSLVKLVDSNTKVPGGTGNFTPTDYGAAQPFQPEGCMAPVVGSASAVFTGSDGAGNFGLYSVPLGGGKVLKLANYKTAIPGGALPNTTETTFNKDYHFCNVSVSGTTIAFDALGGNGYGVYRISTNGAGLTRIADANTAVTGPPPFPVVGAFLTPAIVGQSIVYIGATTGGPFGVFTSNKTTSRASVINSQSTEGDNYDQFATPTFGGSTVLFAADLNGSEEGNVLTKVNLDGTNAKVVLNLATTAVPKKTLGDKFQEIGTDAYNYLGNDEYRQIFSAITYDAPPKDYAAYDGVYGVCNGKIAKIIETGDTVGSLQIRALGGISKLQHVTIGGAKVDEFAAEITLGAPGSPSVYNGAPAIYTVQVPAC